MKKLFTMVAMAFMAVCVNAQSTDKTWNFADWEAKEYTETFTKDGLTLYAKTDKSVTIEEHKKTVNDVKYTQRLKFGGTGSVDARCLEFEVDGACTIEVVLTSASGKEERKLNICANEFSKDNPLASLPASNSGVTLESHSYTGGAGKIVLGSYNSGINIYAIYVKYSNVGTAIENVKTSVESNGKAYNLGGRVATKGLLIMNGKKVIK